MSAASTDTRRHVDLLDSLREAVDYATTAGLLKDASALDVLDAAEGARQRGEKIDLKAVSAALNEMVALIAPLSLADLEFDRNPLSPTNQARARRFQFWLPVLALVLLLSIGYFMQSLRYAHSFVARVERVEGQNPEYKLAALQQMILFDEPLEASKPRDTMRGQYLEKVAELQRLSTELVSLSAQARELAPGLNRVDAAEPGVLERLNSLLLEIKSLGADAEPVTMAPVFDRPGLPQSFCKATESGELILPEEWRDRPQWMQRMAADDLRNFCFKLLLQVGRMGQFSPDMGAIVPKLINATPVIRERIGLYSEWILPFLYGLLGSMLYMMRAVGNIRLPAMQPLSILMRIALGGMAGIMIGWFAIGDPGSRSQASSAVAWPFVLAFVAGYGIEALFSILDRMNRFIADTSVAKRDGANG
jgi:hypothetical protein